MGDVKMSVNWNQIVEMIKNEILPEFERQQIKPTLRTLFYALVSKQAIPNTKSAYKRLSRKLVQARKDKVFAWDFLEDKTRYIIKGYSASYPEPEELDRVKSSCEYWFNKISIEKLLNEWFEGIAISPYVGYWAKQPNTVELWIEKDALAATIKAWTKKVNIRVNRGYSSWTFIYENVKELKRLLERHEKIIILYLGDLDPSGVDIERFLKESLEYFELDKSKVELKRLAVTPEQVEKYNLPPRPEDAETLAKLQRDPRMAKYTGKYIVELDALVVYAPQEFKQLINNEIEKYHDKEIYNKTKEEAKRIAKKSEEIVEEYKKKALNKIIEEAKSLM